MPRVLIVLFVLASLPQKAQAQNHMLFLGGGSEPEDKPTTIFDNEVAKVGSFISTHKNWNTRVSFNGGHATTEKIIRSNFPKSSLPNKPFTGENFESLLKSYETKLERGEIKSGEQLLLYITTHGAVKKRGEKGHKIALAGKASKNLNSLDDADLVSTDRLQKIIDLAQKKGVKLGILDFSCHSGSTLALKNPNTCIISSSGPNHFGYSSYGERFAANMAKGKNLEDVFLQTFAGRDETAFPMISSPVGTEVQDQLYTLVSDYLQNYVANPDEDKLTAILEDQVLENRCEDANAHFGHLNSLLQDLDKVLRPQGTDTLKLREALSQYHQFQDSMKQSLMDLNLTKLTNSLIEFCSESKGKEKCDEWSHKEIIKTNHDEMIAYFEKLKKGKAEAEVNRYNLAIANLRKAKIKKQELLSKNPDYKRYVEIYKKAPELEAKTWNMAQKVSYALQDVYTALYKKKASADKRPNPCKSFTL